MKNSSINKSKLARIEREKKLKLIDMTNFKATLSRLSHESKQTLSRFYLFDGVNEVFNCAVLELPDRNNANSISRIPSGVYTCVERWSNKYGWHYHVLNVPNRSFILMHFGNYYTSTRGCLLMGNTFADINKDGFRDVTSSKKTMRNLMSKAPKQFELTINN